MYCVLFCETLITCPFKRPTRGVIFGFGVANDNVVGRDKKKRFVISRFAEKLLPLPGVPSHQAVGIFQLLSVAQNHVVGKGV